MARTAGGWLCRRGAVALLAPYGPGPRSGVARAQQVRRLLLRHPRPRGSVAVREPGAAAAQLAGAMACCAAASAAWAPLSPPKSSARRGFDGRAAAAPLKARPPRHRYRSLPSSPCCRALAWSLVHRTRPGPSSCSARLRAAHVPTSVTAARIAFLARGEARSAWSHVEGVSSGCLGSRPHPREQGDRRRCLLQIRPACCVSAPNVRLLQLRRDRNRSGGRAASRCLRLADVTARRARGQSVDPAVARQRAQASASRAGPGLGL